MPVSTPTPAWERELREAVAEIDAEVAVGVPRALEVALDQERLKPRVLAWMLSAFAAFAALLALLGMYGVVSYAVRQREREVAVRMAIGADRRSVTGLFVRQGSLVLVAGVVAGALGAIGMGRILSAQLYGVGPDRSDRDRVGGRAVDALRPGRDLVAGAPRRLHGSGGGVEGRVTVSLCPASGGAASTR